LGDGAARREREHGPDQQRQQRGTCHGTLRPADHLVYLVQPGRHPDDARPARYGHVEERLPDGVAAAFRRAAALAQGCTYLRTRAVVFDGRKRADRKVTVGADPATPVYQGDAVFYLTAKPMYRRLPGSGVFRQSLVNQTRLVLQRTRDIGFEIMPEGAFGHPEQDGYYENENEDRSEDQPLGEAHRPLAPRSFPLKR
jgi:hypothetical protein